MSVIRVVQWGLGAMGSGMVKLLAGRTGVEVVGVIDKDPAKVGRDLGEVVDGVEKGVIISDNPEKVLSETNADLVLLTTGSFITQVYSQIMQSLDARCNVITIAEEMAAPEVVEKELAFEMDRLAREKGVTVVGTGINPGFVLDTLIIALSGVCCDIERIEAERVNDLSPFGQTVMETQGVGTSPAQFMEGVANGTIVGHIGFQQSITLIAKALGWDLDEIREEKEPIISKTYRETSFVKIQPGMVAGCNHRSYGYKDGKLVITLKHPQQIIPEIEGVKTGDYITIYGTPPVNLAINPEVPGGIGTIAIAVNMIPLVINSEPGLKTLADLPLASTWKKL